MRFSTAVFTTLLSLSLLACDGGSDTTEGGQCDGAKCDDADGTGDSEEFVDQAYCLGIRGNGQLITGHFASMSRIIEHYGLADGVSGGSSGSISSFLLESVQMNPAVVSQCGDKVCDAEEAANRAALLLKSLQGYVVVLAGTPEAAAIGQLIPVAQQAAAQDIAALAETDPQAAYDALQELLSSEDIRGLINPELLGLLQSSPNPQYHVQDVANALSGLASFEATDPRILVRPGLIDFAGLAEKVGRIGSFYAGYGNYDAEGFEAFMQGCATPGRGMSWAEVAALPVGDSGATCGDAFGALATAWRDDFLNNEAGYRSRIDDQIGGELPALISTSVITGASVQRWAGARDAYFAAEEEIELNVDFNDVKFGYFGDQDLLDTAARNSAGFDDVKTEKFHAIGPATWRTALSYSPAEPGLARALELEDGTVSAGGWSDLHPTLVLRNMGCDNVVYVTRTDVDLGGFADGVAMLLGMDETTRAKLYDLDEDSAIAASVAEADAVWCTNWNDIPATDIAAVSDDSYNAVMITEDPSFTMGAQAYENIDPAYGPVGCAVQ